MIKNFKLNNGLEEYSRQNNTNEINEDCSIEDVENEKNSVPLSLNITLDITDTEIINHLNSFKTDGEKENYAIEALKIGILALKHAGTKIDTSNLRNEGDHILNQLSKNLESHKDIFLKQIEIQLKECFHPNSGHLAERLNKFVSKNGDLEKVLEKMTGPSSDLSIRLKELIGKDSHIVRMFEPNQKNNILDLLRSIVSEELKKQEDIVLSEFSLDNNNSALTRLIKELKDQYQSNLVNMSKELNEITILNERLNRLVSKNGDLEKILEKMTGPNSDLSIRLRELIGKDSHIARMFEPGQKNNILDVLKTIVSEELKKQEDIVLSQFSLDNNNSALTRLIKELKNQQQIILSEFSLDNDNSSLKRFFKEIKEENECNLKNMSKEINDISSQFSLDKQDSIINRLIDQLNDKLNKHHEANLTFQEKLQIKLANIEMLEKNKLQPSISRGFDFEKSVIKKLKEYGSNEDIHIDTSTTVGNIPNCKVGDMVIECGPESKTPGARIVIEAKDRADVSFSDARYEIEKARKNRNASIGIFIFSASQDKIPSGYPNDEIFHRYGSDIFIIWDNKNSITSDIALKAAYTTAKALVIRNFLIEKDDNKDNCITNKDISNMEKNILTIEKKLNSLEDITKCSSSILKNANKIAEKCRIMKNGIEKELYNLDSLHKKIVKNL